MITVNLSKVAIILRHVSGSGSSTFAEYLRSINLGKSVVCTADNYFINAGEYKFDATKLGKAHAECRHDFEDAMKRDIPLVICANTNTAEKDVKVYLDLAKQYDYTCFVLVVENRHGNKDVHNVPEETLARQESALKGSIKLR